MSIFDVFRIKRRIPSPWAKYYKRSDMKIKIPNITMYDQVRVVVLNTVIWLLLSIWGERLSIRSLLS